jgi:hypothetical protein
MFINIPSRPEKSKTHSPKHPLQHLTILIRLFYRVEPELAFRVIMLLQIQQNSSRFKNGKVVPLAIDEDGDSSIRV